MADPITLGTSLALGVGGSLLSSLFGKKPPKPEAPPPMAAPASSPTGNQDTNKPKNQASFLSQATPPSVGNRGQSTLLGQ
jgi:hypothetical protein